MWAGDNECSGCTRRPPTVSTPRAAYDPVSAHTVRRRSTAIRGFVIRRTVCSHFATLSTESLKLRPTSFQLRALFGVVSSLVLVATIWSVRYAHSVDELRAEVAERVAWLTEVRAAESQLLGDTHEGIAPKPGAATASLLALAATLEDRDPALAEEISRTAARAANRVQFLQETGSLVDQIRQGNRRLSVHLGDEIDKLNLMVAIVAGSAGLIVLLFGWGLRRDVAAGHAEGRAESLTVQLDYLAATSPAMLYTAKMEPPFDYQFVSNNVVRIFGFMADSLEVSTSRHQWVHPDDRSKVLAGLRRAKENGRHVHEYRVSTVQGHYRWVRDECRAPDEDAPQLLVGCIIDVTERRLASTAFEELIATMEDRVSRAVADVEAHAEKTRAIIDAAMDAVLLVDSEGKIAQANHAADAVFGRPQGELVGTPIGEIFVDEDWQVPDPGSITSSHGQCADGSVVPLELSVGRTSGVFGGPVSVLVARDITEQERILADLEARAQDLVQTNAELKTFTAATSHDMKEPLRQIQAFAGLLGETDAALDSTTAKYVRYMGDSAGRLTRLVDDLLEYAQTGKTTLSLVDFSLDDLVRDVLDDLGEQIRETNAAIQVEPLGTIHSDRVSVQRIVQNLTANALAYAKPGSPPAVCIRADRNDGHVTLQVADRGIGFDPEYAERIFQPFKRLGTGDANPGTGIGLAITRKIVHALGGTIAAESAPDEGATFTVTLPLSPTATDA